MKTILFANIKGGVGKSTFAGVLYEAMQPFRAVGAQDGDSQGTFSEIVEEIEAKRGVRPAEQPDVMLVDTRGELGAVQTDTADLIISPTGLTQPDISALAKFVGRASDSERARMVLLPNRVRWLPSRQPISEHQEALAILRHIVEEQGLVHLLPPVSDRPLLAEMTQVFPENPFLTVPKKYRKRGRTQSFLNMIQELEAVVSQIETMLDLDPVERRLPEVA